MNLGSCPIELRRYWPASGSAVNGFSPLFRASTPGTYKLPVNALLLPRIG